MFSKIISLNCSENVDCSQTVESGDSIYIVYIILVSVGAFGALTNFLK